MGAGEAERAAWETRPGGSTQAALEEVEAGGGLLEGRGDVRGVGRVA